MLRCRTLVVPLVAVAVLARSTPAGAELVRLSSGRTMSVKTVELTEQSAVMTLRTGGQVIVDRAVVVRIDPDEVVWPNPPTPAADGPESQPAPPGPGVEADPSRAARMPEIPPIYRHLVRKLSAAHRIDERLVHAVIAVESAYQPRARSPKGARGLMQLMPATARQYGVGNAYNPTANLEGGIRHLRSLLDRFEPSLALAAYNAGEAAVRRFGGMPPYQETRDYVAKVLALAASLPIRQR